MHVADQVVEISERAEQRIDVAVVGDVVAEVSHGRAEDGRDPNGINAKPLKMAQALADAAQIADAVAVRVLERVRVDLVDHAALPPMAFHVVSPLEINGLQGDCEPRQSALVSPLQAGAGDPCSGRTAVWARKGHNSWKTSITT